MRKLALCAITLVLACAPKKNTPINEIPQLKTLEEVMDNQSTTADPEFAKIGQASFSDADFAALGRAAERLQATSLKVKDFANGRAEFDAFAGRLNEKAKALGTAAAAKDGAGAKTALTDMKATCKECHGKFR
jgi:cytochrome c556